uniref:Uncharacterized protein n=1 Tax=Glossina brevipalpis TaxID=37001 RepID=A0A1A9WCG9_9MUSC
MAAMEDILDNIRDIFCRYKERQKIELQNMLNDLRNRDHRSRLNEARKRKLWFKKMTRFHQFMFGIFSFFVIFGTYKMWLINCYDDDEGRNSFISFLWPFGSRP